MTFRYRLASLLVAGGLALPALATAVVATAPGAAAQTAWARCGSREATISFSNGSTICQGVGTRVYNPAQALSMTRICAGRWVSVQVIAIPIPVRSVGPNCCVWIPPHTILATVKVQRIFRPFRWGYGS
jgi:hypothetical protein